MQVNEAMFWVAALHEATHIIAARLLRVKIADVGLKENNKAYITVEKYNRFQLWFIQLFPWLFDLPFGLYWFKGYFKVVWLKVWFSLRCHFPECILGEFRD